MRKSRFTQEQMVAALREADRTSVAKTAKKHKVSEQTIYAWRKHFGERAGTRPCRCCLRRRTSERRLAKAFQRNGGRTRQRRRGDGVGSSKLTTGISGIAEARYRV